MSIVWDILYAVAFVGGAWIVLLLRRLRRKRNRGGWRERCGHVSAREGDRPCLWVHGVSVGEVQSAQALVERFAAKHPDWDVVVSSTTDTGLAAAARTFPDIPVIRYPFDFSWAVRRAFARVRPSLIVLMEGDLWPNFARAAADRGVPVVIANGRVSDRHFPRSMRFRFLLAGAFGRLAAVGAQTEEYASRFVALGAPRERIRVTGSLKYDALPSEPPDPAPLRRALGLAEGDPVLVAGSTTEGEEEILLLTYAWLRRDFPTLRLAVVPRHPERFDAVERFIAARGLACVRRSSSLVGGDPCVPPPAVQKEGPPLADARGRHIGGPLQEDAVILGDTMGELMTFYALATVVFVGKSLVPPGGGQNMIEPASLGKPVVFGPCTSNFRETRDALISRDAAREVRGPGELGSVLKQLLSDSGLRTMLGRNARAVVDSLRGATDRTLDILEDVLASRPKRV